ncbi:hypothetical protein [uncultured Enterobacter sp.]|uniref:hypothetical protein n=1 Tax=uncultured Enterobacter sp. TaxID=238202 RepID=UPI00261000E4|nr:hypothetical protein [uncultured Enterobacter sp.]
MTQLSEMNINEYDRRQLSLMKETLNSYLTNKISFKKLIDNLEGLLYILQDIDIAWKNEFHEQWFVLEQVYAVALFRDEIIEPNDPDIESAIKHLEKLLTS